jgi:hypothetical protein
VVLASSSDRNSVFLQTLRANSSVERPDESVIRRFARTTEVESDLMDMSLLAQSLRRELRADVNSDRFQRSTVFILNKLQLPKSIPHPCRFLLPATERLLADPRLPTHFRDRSS